jgi:antirestriction protein ArdC
MTNRIDLYTRVTNSIVAELEKGVRPWLKPWNAEHAAGRITRPLRGNGVPYRGVNVLMLWSAATAKGYGAPVWMTFRQALELNAHVRKSEQGSLVVYADRLTRTEANADSGAETERSIPFMKSYTVFNVEQIDGLPEDYHQRPKIQLTPVERNARAEAFFRNTGAEIRYRGDRAFYACELDYIQMPVIGGLPRRRKLLCHSGARGYA